MTTAWSWDGHEVVGMDVAKNHWGSWKIRGWGAGAGDFVAQAPGRRPISDSVSLKLISAVRSLVWTLIQPPGTPGCGRPREPEDLNDGTLTSEPSALSVVWPRPQSPLGSRPFSNLPHCQSESSHSHWTLGPYSHPTPCQASTSKALTSSPSSFPTTTPAKGQPSWGDEMEVAPVSWSLSVSQGMGRKEVTGSL